MPAAALMVDAAGAVGRRSVVGASPVVSYGEDALFVSSLGHDQQDSTQFLQAALDSTASTVVIDQVPGGWVTDPLFLNRGDVTIVVEPGVMVKAKPNSFPGSNDSLLTVRDAGNVLISGYGASFAMQKKQYTSGEWRMALKLLGVQDVTVEGLVLRDSGGDGVYIGRSNQSAYCSNVVLRDLVCDNNRRNALSVISVDGLVVEGCQFSQTQGTLPESGVDFEPNFADERISNITMTDCVFEGNITRGVSVILSALDQTSAPVSVLIDRATVSHHMGESRQLPSAVFMTSAR
ncbi:right-handed parallel beta-helix repeat-containing protein, partial [Phytoactinopolyspora limicola]|uniref:right-handed parallel beta-helix repeat-containing protein n=1 Tax=Phytoactinopolyspora limicola TaxID=2715536 RepID=UPI0014098ADC